MANMSDRELLDALGVESKVKKKAAYTPKEERIIAGFEEIQKFVEEHGRAPQHGEDNDIFERLYAVRLDQIRKKKECRELLKDMDTQGLLGESTVTQEVVVDDLEDDELLAQLGVDAADEDSITNLKHVKPRAEIRAAEEIANRVPCNDFEKFKPLFEAAQKELDSGIRISRVIRKDAGFLKTDIKQGEFFILGGQTIYIAKVGETIKAPNGQTDARLRVIYSNGTENDLLLRSLQRAIYKDETSRHITNPTAGPLFSGESGDDDIQSGTIYVLRSKSDHPIVKENRDVVHKIGVTGGDIKKRIANAKDDPTFLLDDVEVVATYELYNINSTKLEGIIHKFFSPAKLDIQIKDRFGKPVTAREWFLVPLFIIDEAVEKIREGSIGDYFYDLETAAVKQRSE
ncbi:MAG: GIY-YIG nuclease family protein [Alphaproteobacteria bacterium]|nr:GIY-YIG nuclease family protein [Alphaproteobacteria bacterium]